MIQKGRVDDFKKAGRVILKQSWCINTADISLDIKLEHCQLELGHKMLELEDQTEKLKNIMAKCWVFPYPFFNMIQVVEPRFHASDH